MNTSIEANQSKQELLNFKFSVRKEPVDFSIVKKLKALENESLQRCALLHFKTNNELSQLYYFILMYYDPLLDVV